MVLARIPGPKPQHGRTVVLADLLVDGAGGAPIARPAVSIVDGRIVAVVSRGSDWLAPAGWAVIDESGGTLLPGFVDAHIHLAFPEPDEAYEPGELAAEAARNAATALVGGVTTVRDLGCPDSIVLRLRDAIAAGTLPGPRILAAGPPITISGGHCHWFGRLADSGAELLAAVDELAASGVDVVKFMATGGMTTIASNPYAAQYTLHELRPAVRRAHDHGLRVAAHVLCTAGVRVAIEAGVDTLEHGWTITGRPQDFVPEMTDEVARAGVTGSVSAHDSLRDLLPSGTSPGDLVELRRRLIPHRALAAAGVPMVVHSDAGPGPTRYDDFAASIRAFALGMETTPVVAFAAATSTPAAALGLADELGVIGVGRVADLVVVAGDALRESPTRDRVRRVIQGGRTVVLNGRLVDRVTRAGH